ncbi:hypothetical protein ACO2Q8_12060 [Larkinella sp. VNQ87]
MPNPACEPLDALVRPVEINTLQMLKTDSIPMPVEAVNGEYVL